MLGYERRLQTLLDILPCGHEIDGKKDLIPSDVAHPVLDTPQVDSVLLWMRKKDIMGQDMYLLGGYGPLRRWIALKYCALRGREVEYIALTRDHTEADLKQRREIIAGGTVAFTDLQVVTAAIHGRVLLIEGLEKAERNVLPIINNLLENREMALEDGRFLLSGSRYDALLSTRPSQELADLGLVRVHPDFRVVALGVPVPPYP
ncbi:hypothetical protein CYMTET_29350, partial [Cymbomonas tetramitiformis]|eukprot:gene26218-32130_t